MADTNTYDSFQKVEKWTTKEKFNALDLHTIETGTEYNLTGAIEESDLGSDLLKKINGKLTAPTTPNADSVVTMLSDGTVGTKPLSEIGGGGGGKLYMHLVNVVDQRDFTGIVMSFYTSSNVAFTPSTFKDYFRQYYGLSGVAGKGNRQESNYPSYAYVKADGDPVHDNDVITYYTQGNGESGETTLVLSEFNDSYGSFYDTCTEV